MFDNFSDFLAMGGYGPYIWISYAVCFGLIAVLAAQSILRWRRLQRELDLLKASRSRRNDA